MSFEAEVCFTAFQMQQNYCLSAKQYGLNKLCKGSLREDIYQLIFISENNFRKDGIFKVVILPLSDATWLPIFFSINPLEQFLKRVTKEIFLPNDLGIPQVVSKENHFLSFDIFHLF